MKVATTLLLLGLVVLAFAQGPSVCLENQCVEAEEVCGWITNVSYTGCKQDAFCTKAQSTVRTGTGICRLPARLGDSCVSLTQCESGTSCSGGVCALNAPITSERYYPGESCDYNIQCIYNSPYGGGDDEDLCGTGKCKHVSTGDYCDSTDQCDHTSAYCGRKNMCEKYIKDGDACHMNDETVNGCGTYDRKCMPNSANGNAGTCRRKHSQSVNEYCSNIDDCEEGLLCQYPESTSYGLCYKPYETNTLGFQCPNTNSSENYGCNATNFETCKCTSDGINKCLATVRPSGFHDADWDYTECLRRHYCSSSAFSCIKDHCQSEACTYYNVLRKTSSQLKSCFFDGLCNSAFTLAASPVLAFLALIAILAL